MANMTIAIEDSLLRAARVKAVQQGTSVNEICRQAIEAFARGATDADARVARLKALAKKVRSPDRKSLEREWLEKILAIR